MNLSFLPENLTMALAHLNYNFLTEIRLRRGKTVIVEYNGGHKYLGVSGITDKRENGIIVDEVDSVLLSATDGCIYNFSEQIKSGFITVGYGVRIGIAGEYVTQNGGVLTIKNATSLNIRIPHDVKGCAVSICDRLLNDGLKDVLIYSKPGLGKTTMLRDIAHWLSKTTDYNVLVFDERNEICAVSGTEYGFELGDNIDVVRCHNKKSAIASAIRAMKPDIVITDELYGQDDIAAIRYAVDCGINVIASSHVCNPQILKTFPFEYYVKLTGIGFRPIIYDKDFNTYSSCDSYDAVRNIADCQ